jgi:multidrug efflux system membrane fusion protein
MHQVTVQKQDENQTVIASGVNPGERVVTTGFVQLTDGKAVTIGSDNAAGAAPTAAPGQGQGQRANGQRGPRGDGQRGDGQRGPRGDGNGRRAPAGAQ